MYFHRLACSHFQGRLMFVREDREAHTVGLGATLDIQASQSGFGHTYGASPVSGLRKGQSAQPRPPAHAPLPRPSVPPPPRGPSPRVALLPQGPPPPPRHQQVFAYPSFTNPARPPRPHYFPRPFHGNGGGGNTYHQHALPVNGRQLFVGNISPDTTWATLKVHFRQFVVSLNARHSQERTCAN